MTDHAFSQIADPRGILSAYELDDAPFLTRRVFVVSGPLGGAWRGEHQASCEELIVLIGGRVLIELDDEPQPGSWRSQGRFSRSGRVNSSVTTWRMRERLVLVLASMPYERRNEA